jgi:hypothetical protein
VIRSVSLGGAVGLKAGDIVVVTELDTPWPLDQRNCSTLIDLISKTGASGRLLSRW